MDSKPLAGILTLLSVGMVVAVSVPAVASTIEMQFHPTDDSVAKPCPTKVMAYQTPRPYREGGYETDGRIDLNSIATDVAIWQTDLFSVTWAGKLKPKFRECQGTAGISVVDGQPYQGHSYLRLQLRQGKVYFILDMTGMQDANQMTPVILNRKVQQGNPYWTWGGTD